MMYLLTYFQSVWLDTHLTGIFGQLNGSKEHMPLEKNIIINANEVRYIAILTYIKWIDNAMDQIYYKIAFEFLCINQSKIYFWGI